LRRGGHRDASRSLHGFEDAAEYHAARAIALEMRMERPLDHAVKIGAGLPVGMNCSEIGGKPSQVLVISRFTFCMPFERAMTVVVEPHMPACRLAERAP